MSEPDRFMSVSLAQTGKHARDQLNLLNELDPEAAELRRLIRTICDLYDRAFEVASEREKLQRPTAGGAK